MLELTTFPKSFNRHQILLDDVAGSDALIHFPACIEWIDSELKKDRGVLVHCQVCGFELRDYCN